MINIQHRTSNIQRRMWHRSRSAGAFAACRSHLYIKKGRIQYSVFSVQCSMLDVHFLLKSKATIQVILNSLILF